MLIMCLPRYHGNFCCCTLRFWSLIIGWIFMVGSLVACGFLTWMSTQLTTPDYQVELIISVYAVAAVFTMFLCTFNFLLLHGLYKRNATFLLPWLTLVATSLLVYIILEFFNIILLSFPKSRRPYYVNLDQLGFVIVALCFIVVQSYYKETKETRTTKDNRFYNL